MALDTTTSCFALCRTAGRLVWYDLPPNPINEQMAQPAFYFFASITQSTTVQSLSGRVPMSMSTPPRRTLLKSAIWSSITLKQRLRLLKRKWMVPSMFWVARIATSGTTVMTLNGRDRCWEKTGSCPICPVKAFLRARSNWHLWLVPSWFCNWLISLLQPQYTPYTKWPAWNDWSFGCYGDGIHRNTRIIFVIQRHKSMDLVTWNTVKLFI